MTAIEGDRLSQVLINLTANAILHNDKSSRRITVSSFLSEDGKYYRVSIKDNGPGIPPELTKRIFEPFYRGTSHGSAGLGLPISDRILRRYGGSLSVKSDGTSGAEFIVTLPVYRSGEGWRSLEDSNPKPAD
ncbi:sensor histidine kinase [Amaricoccus tamworthensis]|uniref:sensor histidine kinase n=1 Tax=Amaricoccus tamworthensis TaxID=57002 RepID=UPI003C7B59A9